MLHMFGDIFVLDAFFVASDMVSSGLMEGYGFYEDIVPQLRSDYVTSYKTSVVMSIGLSPFEFFCFRFLPLRFRCIMMNFTDIIWCSVMSFMSHKWCHEDVNIAKVKIE